MPEWSFLVQGSGAEPYAVRFIAAGGQLTANCTCPAGGEGQACKHRLGILSGQPEGVVEGTSADVAEVRAAVAGTPLQRALEQLSEAEEMAAQAKARVSAAKKVVSRVMRGA